MLTLSLILGQPQLPSLHRELRTASPSRLVQICRNLGEAGDGRSVGYLAATARKHSGPVRTAAIRGLIDYLDDPEPFSGPYARMHAIGALQSMAEWAREDLVRIVRHERCWRRVQGAVAILDRVPDRRLISRLIEIAEAPYKQSAPNDSELYATYQARNSAIKMLTELRAIEAAPMMLRWMGTRERYHAVRYFEEVSYEPARQAVAETTLAARVRQGDDAAYREAVDLARNPTAATIQREDALKAVAIRGDAEARDVLHSLAATDAAAWLIRLGDSRGWLTFAESGNGTLVNYFQIPKTPANVAALEAALAPRINKNTGLIFSFENAAALAAIDRLASKDETFRQSVRGRVDRLRFQVTPSAYRAGMMGTFRRLRTELDGSFEALRAAWDPLARYLRDVLANRFDASAVPASEMEADWRVAEKHVHSPLYVTATNMPGAVYVRLYTAQLEGLEPVRGEARRDLQGAFLFWKDGSIVRYQDVTELQGGRYISPGKDGNAARIGSRVLLGGFASEPHMVFTTELQLRGSRWKVVRRWSHKAEYGADVRLSVRNGQFWREVKWGREKKWERLSTPR